MHLTLRVDVMYDCWNIAGVARVRMLPKFRRVGCHVHLLTSEVLGNPPDELRRLLADRMLEAAVLRQDRIAKRKIPFDHERFLCDLK